MDTQTKREREKRMVSQMIALYCRKKHHTRGDLCPQCAALDAYAKMRADKCPFMETKTFCSNCRIHCYKPDMRAKIREVMRFAGPRMILHHPVAAIRHVVETKKEQRRLGRIK
ncbi:MAG TPA: nitrous oxide-stimulated promoter family protein [Candidatus Limiplasma stercoravium]|nr:nitrous oxide-stimulated promoter family protein [Candidatus Limiplasma stercoravium]